MRHSDIIEVLADCLGSQQTLAWRLGVDESRLSKWKYLGIPPRHWPDLLRIAHRKRIRLTLDQIHIGSPGHRRNAKNGGC